MEERKRNLGLPAGPLGNGFGRFFNGNPELGMVDFCINGLRLVPGLSYKGLSEITSLPEGRCQIDVFKNGQWVASKVIVVQKGVDYFGAVCGNAWSVDLFVSAFDFEIIRGESAAWFIHLSADIPNLDVSVHKGDVVFPGLPYLRATEVLPIAPVSFNLEARLAGTKTILCSMPAISFEANKAHLVCLIHGDHGMEAAVIKQ